MGDKIPAFSEAAIAIQFVRDHGQEFLSNTEARQIYSWNGALYAPDKKNKINAAVHDTCIEFAALAFKDPKTENIARSLASARTTYAVVKLLASNPELVVVNSELDANPMLLGTPKGVVDLHTGELLPPDRKYRITMSTSVVPAPPGTPHPLWDKYLQTTHPRVPGDSEPDSELIEFFQRWHGYCLTGATREEVFTFDHGGGRNGKGVRLETALNILGDYAAILPAEALMERPLEPHAAELAVLRAKRFVVSDEIPRGKRWNQQRLTVLTGGGNIKANLMRENPSEFLFQGKLNIGGNFKPVFPTANRAIRDRLLLIQYRMQFLNAEEYVLRRDDPTVGLRDNTLKENLRAEYPAILRWFIEGCLRWQNEGLRIPKSILEDGNDYLAGQDDLAPWIAACCAPNPTATAGDRVKTLFSSWCRWCREDGEVETGTYPQFRATLSDRGYTVTHRKKGTVALGLFLTDLERARISKYEKQEAQGAANREAEDPSQW